MYYYDYLTDIGKVRKFNEDSVGFFINKQGLFLGIIADGIGGHQSGYIASSLVVMHLGYYFKKSVFNNINDAYEWLKIKLNLENNILIDNGERYSDLYGMGTTFVCILGDNNEVLISNAGDSRCYFYKKNVLKQITQDHSLLNELLNRGEINEKDAQSFSQKNVIVRALGMSRELDIDCYYMNVRKDDVFLLCSDGLSKVVNDIEILNILHEDTDLHSKCKDLISLAYLNGGTDNVSVLLVSMGRG